MDDKVWNEGEPPHIGWWLTKDRNNVQRWCWWDGNFFLYHAQAKGNLAWSDYYPEGARVPRVDPSDPKNFAIVSLINTGTPTALQAVERLMCNRRSFDRLPDGSTRTVREMKERMTPPPPPPGYVAGSRQRLSDAVRVGDVDFSGAMKRNQDPNVDRRCRDKDPTCFSGARMRAGSNGQPPAQNPEPREIGDPFHGISTMTLMKELFRRFNAAP